MGYKRPGKLHTLTWGEGSELHGLQVVVRSLSIGALVQFAGLAAKITADGVTPAELAEAAPELFGAFAGRLAGWNLEDDTGPVPATLEGVESQDLEFVVQIVLAWMEAVASVGNPLPDGSGPSPPPGPEASLPMEPLPASPSS